MEYLALVFSQTPENQVDNLRKALLALCVDRNFEITWQTAWAYDFEEIVCRLVFLSKPKSPTLRSSIPSLCGKKLKEMPKIKK